jgi:hypothetical protein
MEPGRLSDDVVLLAAITTFTPALARVRAHSRPMPREAPVMIATFPARLMLNAVGFRGQA